MKNNNLYSKFIILVVLVLGAFSLQAQQKTWFVDGYHGGVYGHYPEWQAKFMVEKLTANPDWKICLEIEPETWDTVSVHDAENFKALQEYYSTTGRFGGIEFVNPTWAQPYCYNVSGESNIRQFKYGMAKIREYFPEATFTTYSVEEPCFTSSLPQILKGFGFKYAVLRNPNTCWGGYTSAFGKDLVNWIGPDGTSMPAVPRYECEGLSTINCYATNSNANSEEFIAACFADGIKYPVGMTFQDAGWAHGPWLGNAIKEYYKPSIYTTWTEYIDMVKDEVEATDWAFRLEDVKPGLVWGSQVLQKLAQEVRVGENRVVMAEKMASLDYLYTGKAWPDAEFAEAWRTLMLAQHHDCWIVPYNGRPGNTWADKVTRWTGSSNRIADEKIARLFSEVEGNDAKYIRVFNTLGNIRTDRVSVELPGSMKLKGMVVIDQHGKELPSQCTADNDGQLMLQFEATVPGMGYCTYVVKEKKSKTSPVSAQQLSDGNVIIETEYYTALIDSKRGGTITSLVDKKNDNRQLVEKGKELNDLRGYFYRESKFHDGSDTPAKVSIMEDGGMFTRIKVENKLAGNSYYQVITFNKHNPRIDFELHIDWDGQPGIGAYDQSNNYKAEVRAKAFYNDNYKLHLQFPLQGLGEKLLKNGPFDVCESELDNTLYSSWDSIKHNVVLNWVDIEDASKAYGVALFTDHTTSYLQTEELPLGLTVQYVGRALWGRNYRVHGPTHMHYALLPHAGDWEAAGVEVASNEWNEPLTGSFVKSDSNPLKRSLLEYDDANIHVSSVTMDGGDMLVRFYSTSSVDKQHEVIWNCTADKMEQVDLNGKKISDVQANKASNGEMTTKLSLPQFGFQTIKLTNVKMRKDDQ
ncbi:glycoside hydrolase family 38 C-terminal domain-containing protein [Sunxiuqinia sp. A32]|uniref:glycoside hydrolase family 38 C-terminal domain-containing protein n=1 Tax=Sunxiuqinia sp. A32 TaxID=3461496 RepID=UPI0040454A7C